jgi:hypothetical protein
MSCDFNRKNGLDKRFNIHLQHLSSPNFLYFSKDDEIVTAIFKHISDQTRYKKLTHAEK